MFKKLRNRFLFLHMGIVTLLVLLFFGSILVISYTGLERTTNDRLDRIWAARVTPHVSFSVMGVASEKAAPDGMPAEAWIVRPAMPGLGMMMNDSIWITIDDEKNIIEIDSPYSMPDDTFYQKISSAAYASARGQGKLNVDEVILKYKTEGNQLLAIDVSSEFSIFSGMLMSFLMIALPLLVMIFLLSLFFANRSIRPIEQSFNRQKEFIADASHELKTPLAAITTNLEAAAGSARPEQQKWLGYIQSEVGRMAELTSGLLYLTKMDHGGANTKLPVSLGQLLQDVLLPLEALIYEKGLVMEADIDDSVAVMGEEEQLRKLISILADNALRYAQKNIRVSLVKSQNSAVLTFENDGPGIPAHELKKIWERFYRCDHARQYDGGYGLGLPMARTIAERHKGKIACESVEHKKTAFTVRLPL